MYLNVKYFGGDNMREYINNNRATVVSRAIVAGMFAVTAVIAVLFDDVTPATMLFI